MRKIPVAKRFLSKFTITEGCWIWRGAPDCDGYGIITSGGKNILAHRFSYTFHIGPIPEGLLVCHKCDNRICVRPDHLFTGTVQDNNKDRDQKGRCRGGGHPGERCGHAKLKNQDIIEIRKSSATQKELAARFGVVQSCVHKIKRGLTWRHLLPIQELRESVSA